MYTGLRLGNRRPDSGRAKEEGGMDTCCSHLVPGYLEERTPHTP